MNFALNYWFGYYLPVEERLKLIKNAGFNSVLITLEDELEPFYCSKSDVVNKATKLGLVIENAHLPLYSGYNKIWLRSFKENKELFSFISNSLKECSVLGIETLVMHSNDQIKTNISTNNGINFFKLLVEKAHKYNIKIAIENCYSTDITQIVLNSINSKYLGLCYDSGHDFLLNKNNLFYRNYLDRLFAVHLNDNNGIKDDHFIPGEGLINFSNLFDSLNKINFRTAGVEVIADKKIVKFCPPEKFLNRLQNNLKILNK